MTNNATGVHRIFLHTILLTLLMGVYATGCSSDIEAPVAEKTQSVKTPVSIQILTAEEVGKIVSGSRGTITVINFWATWCPPCVKEMPELVTFHEEYRARGVTFLSFSTDSLDDVESKLRPFVENVNATFPVYVLGGCDPDDLERVLPFPSDFPLPTTVLLNPAGEVLHTWTSAIEMSDLQEAVDPLL